MAKKHVFPGSGAELPLHRGKLFLIYRPVSFLRSPCTQGLRVDFVRKRILPGLDKTNRFAQGTDIFRAT